MNPIIINDEVFIYKNFIKSEEIELLYNSSIALKNWDVLQKHDVGEFWKKRLIPYDEVESVFEENGSLVKATLFHIRQRISEEAQKHTNQFLEPGPINMNKFSSQIKGPSKFGEEDNNLEMFFHRDDQQKDIKVVDIGSVAYLNDNFTGGHIVYPDLNFEYKPEAGSLVLHRGTVMHGVSKLIEGTRYMLTCFLFRS
jgi:hypothetical protein